MFLKNLSPQQFNEFRQDGYCIIKDFCTSQEVYKLYCTATTDSANFANAPQLKNQTAAIPMWFTPGNDAFGYLERSEKLVHTVARLLGNSAPVCHIYSKVMEKQPHVAGVWEWHQDYAYWHANKFLSADKMLGVMVALTNTNKQNGGSQLLKGSHKMGRLMHNFEGEMRGADRVSVKKALETMELVYPELQAGDALFFHSNLLHRADANLSDSATWANVSCYSLQNNLAGRQMFTSWTTPVEIVPDETILTGHRYLPSEHPFIASQQLVS